MDGVPGLRYASPTVHIGSYRDFKPIRIASSDRIFVLTGAGISAESGIRTFRDGNGLWEEHRIEDVASPDGWARDPELVWRFYSARREQAQKAKPNLAHRTLAELGRKLGERLFLCTQNVDPLHEAAGSPQVHHMHGELMKSRCELDHAPAFQDDGQYYELARLPSCSCGGRIRPHICWFGEVPYELDKTHDALVASSWLITIGSSGSVYPAAGFVDIARRLGAQTVYVGLEPPENAEMFSECRLGKAGEVLPSLVWLD